MKKILVIGNGGREHSICDALARSPQEVKLYNFASAINPGIKNIGAEIITGDIMDMAAIKKIGEKIQPDFAIVGPDDPIGAGATDALAEVGIKSFSPSKACAQLEASKSFTRNLQEKYNIPGAPKFLVSTSADQVDERKYFFEKLEGQVVVKADGLLGGKGVLVAGDHFTDFQEAEGFALLSIKKFGRVVLEEKFVGEEFSLISLVDGETVLDTPAMQDHKRAFEGDTGPNTGGMGCISDENLSLPFITPEDKSAAHDITVQTMKALEAELGEKFIGVMYGGFIATKNGLKLIEYNARFGDPEALNILPILKTDFVDVCEKAIAGKLSEIGQLEFEPVATVVKYLCPEGYPTNSVKNVPITVSPDLQETYSQRVFYASVSEENGQLLLKGSRAIGVLGTGKNIAEANDNCKAMMQNFSGPLFSRQDIGTAELIQKRLDHMAEIRNN